MAWGDVFAGGSHAQNIANWLEGTEGILHDDAMEALETFKQSDIAQGYKDLVNPFFEPLFKGDIGEAYVNLLNPIMEPTVDYVGNAIPDAASNIMEGNFGDAYLDLTDPIFEKPAEFLKDQKQWFTEDFDWDETNYADYVRGNRQGFHPFAHIIDTFHTGIGMQHVEGDPLIGTNLEGGMPGAYINKVKEDPAAHIGWPFLKEGQLEEYIKSGRNPDLIGGPDALKFLSPTNIIDMVSSGLMGGDEYTNPDELPWDWDVPGFQNRLDRKAAEQQLDINTGDYNRQMELQNEQNLKLQDLIDDYELKLNNMDVDEAKNYKDYISSTMSGDENNANNLLSKAMAVMFSGGGNTKEEEDDDFYKKFRTQIMNKQKTSSGVYG